MHILMLSLSLFTHTHTVFTRSHAYVLAWDRACVYAFMRREEEREQGGKGASGDRQEELPYTQQRVKGAREGCEGVVDMRRKQIDGHDRVDADNDDEEQEGVHHCRRGCEGGGEDPAHVVELVEDAHLHAESCERHIRHSRVDLVLLKRIIRRGRGDICLLQTRTTRKIRMRRSTLSPLPRPPARPCVHDSGIHT